MEEALQNVLAMFLIMVASYVLMKKEPYPVEVVNNLVFHFFLPVTTFYSIARLQEILAGELLLLTAIGFITLYATVPHCNSHRMDVRPQGSIPKNLSPGSNVR